MYRLGLIAVLAIALVSLAPTPSSASGCTSASPLYSAVAGGEGVQSDWFFAGAAGQVGNGYSGTVFVSIFNPSTTTEVKGNIDEIQETLAFSNTQPLLIFGQGFDLQPNRSETLAFNGQAPNGAPIQVPSGKVHFHVSGAPVNVYAEQWLTC